MAVKLYSTPTCGYCKKVKRYLQEKNVDFREFNVANDRKRADEMMKKTGQMGVPVLDINGKVIVGYKEAEIERALRR